jgi:hypothetical protein
VSRIGPFSWSNAVGGTPRDSQQAFLATPEGKAVKLNQIDMISWTHTDDMRMWSEDLRWVGEATYLPAAKAFVERLAVIGSH